MPHVAAIAERHPLLEHSRFRTENQLHRPFHAINAIDISHADRGAAIVMFAQSKINRRHRHPIMRDRKIELDPERRPGPPVSNRRLLDRRIGIKHRLARNLVDARIKMSANIRQHRALQIFIFEVNHPPRMIHTPVGQIGPQRIRIAEPVGSELIEGRIRIGQPLFVSRQSKRPLPHRTSACPANAETIMPMRAISRGVRI